MENLCSNPIVEDYWQEKKKQLIDNIDLAIKRGKADTDILNLMKEMVERAKIRIRFKEKED